jgi:hypothetical protein
MNAEFIIQEVAGRGVILHLDGDTLRWRGPAGAFTPDLQNKVRELKPGIIQSLRAEATKSRGTCPFCKLESCQGCRYEAAFQARLERARGLCQQVRDEWELKRAMGIRQGFPEALAQQKATKEIRESRLFSDWKSV